MRTSTLDHGDEFWALGRLAEARKCYRAASRRTRHQDTYRQKALLRLASVCRASGDLAAAESFYRKTLALGGTREAADAALELADVKIAAGMGSFDEAASLCEVAIGCGFQPEAAAAAFKLGYIQGARGNLDSARCHLNAAIYSGVREWSLRAMQCLGDLASDRGFRAEAERNYMGVVVSGHPDLWPCAVLGLAKLSEQSCGLVAPTLETWLNQVLASDRSDVTKWAKIYLDRLWSAKETETARLSRARPDEGPTSGTRAHPTSQIETAATTSSSEDSGERRPIERKTALTASNATIRNSAIQEGVGTHQIQARSPSRCRRRILREEWLLMVLGVGRLSNMRRVGLPEARVSQLAKEKAVETRRRECASALGEAGTLPT